MYKNFKELQLEYSYSKLQYEYIEDQQKEILDFINSLKDKVIVAYSKNIHTIERDITIYNKGESLGYIEPQEDSTYFKLENFETALWESDEYSTYYSPCDVEDLMQASKDTNNYYAIEVNLYENDYTRLHKGFKTKCVSIYTQAYNSELERDLAINNSILLEKNSNACYEILKLKDLKDSDIDQLLQDLNL